MSETIIIASNPLNGERLAGTVGFALPGMEVRIADEAGNRLAGDDVGMIEVRGSSVFSGYWRMPEKTAEELRENGFFITGDLGTIDADGYVSIVGRSKDLIISGGYNVYPKEIEMAIDDLDGGVQRAVIGVPHLALGAEMAQDYLDRTRVFSYSQLFSTLGVWGFGFLMLTLIFPTTDPASHGMLNADGYRPFSIIAAAGIALSIGLCVLGTAREIPHLPRARFKAAAASLRDALAPSIAGGMPKNMWIMPS